MSSAVKSLNPEFLDTLMADALSQARLSAANSEVPVGAVVAIDGKIVARAHNLVEYCSDPSAHAEILAIREATKAQGNWRLENAILCVTLEPCPMCIGAIRLARIPVIVFGARDARLGAVGSLFDLASDPRLGSTPRVIEGVREQECAEVLKVFFRAKRDPA